MPDKDMLAEIFRMQAELNQRIGVNTLHMPEAGKPEWVRGAGTAATRKMRDHMEEK